MFSKSIFQSNTFRVFAGAVLTAWLGFLQGSITQQEAITATVMAAIALGMRLISNGPVHVVTPVVASQDAPGAAVVKTAASGQGGYSLVGVMLALVLLSGAAVFLPGCAGAPPAPQSPKQTIVYLNATAAIGGNLAHQLYQEKVISYAQEGDVLKASREVSNAVAAAQGFLGRGDSHSAQQQLSAVDASVKLLTDFISAHPLQTTP